MRSPAHILVVDDNAANLDILCARLRSRGYEIFTAEDGEQALAVARAEAPDLILLDVMMPKIHGIEVCRQLKADDTLPFMPIIMVTAKADSKDVVAGLEAGADDYLTKPIDQAALVARVQSMLRIKSLHDTVQEQSTKLEHQAAELAAWNRNLEEKIREKVSENERMGRLKRFVAPQIADMIVSSGDERFLESHRREITVVFADLRGFTAFSETAEPERLMSVLRQYHQAIGALIFEYEATLERFAGDGVMVYFNDPLPCPDPSARAVRLAVAMRRRVGDLARAWREEGDHLDFGVGIASGYATLGTVGFDERIDYAAIGPVTNLASRLCDEAEGGQILINQRVQANVSDLVEANELGQMTLKGFSNPMRIFNVTSLRDS